ncbi:CRISPR system precrRNA processing endoribonuclease RAMP protein Cas6 [Shouchella clausii]|uniref:CRISPR system precrRNA processing endoribonuclease RAMP protein Cas6 n=1 Tax=Shouchella TaxID=2893057 RepID=UPI0004E63932|nr:MULTISPECIES: CRISPR system precrRNA processing endoribonuclease RAMP protein Cas6 [Shouchella]ALA53453.1 CRISPR repeat RNA endoribonuclease Cas6 [Shouchella clausii]MBU3229954.1 CRISPR system precrRNA processing endoribonuclease RAMP protein Cas6 [Shouchella clausii]MBU3263962.1 CRISPR system precrRNA processing endoribonuclease RAMP protein Cas6 [Shouchella clausii]MBU3506855.1 CRISPR system precrRNA processing endoribonuclease RAMP protein Cas6 [Shouchella clausii]MBU3534787.1 CRISPR sys
MFDHIKLLTLRVTYEAKRSGTLPPFLGTTIRGALGHCIRGFDCPTPRMKCFVCPIASRCDYANHFNSVGNEGGAVNPFVIRMVTYNKTSWKVGDKLIFEITLIGETSDHAGLFLDAFQEMEKRGFGAERIPFELKEVSDAIRKKQIWKLGRMSLRHIQPSPLVCKEREAHSVRIKFHSPVRVQVSKKVLYSLTFADIIRSISRRLALLTQAYTDKQLNWNEEAMLSAASDIQTEAQSWRLNDFKRYSMNHKDKLHIPGIEGWARFSGNITPFTPLLEAGERIHFGKNTTHGFGSFSVFYNEEEGHENV